MSTVPEEGVDRGRLVARYVSARISMLQRRYLGKGGKRDARPLAELRRAAGKGPGAVPEAWSLEFEGMPDVLVGSGPEPSRGEWAAHTALTLYAVHQQSQSRPMCVSGADHDFGCAVRRLVIAEHGDLNPNQGQMPHRFAAMVTAQSIDELAHYARQIVGQLRAESIPVDYPRFARQLYWFQRDETRTSACLEWARGYARPAQEQEAMRTE